MRVEHTSSDGWTIVTSADRCGDLLRLRARQMNPDGVVRGSVRGTFGRDDPAVVVLGQEFKRETGIDITPQLWEAIALSQELGIATVESVDLFEE